MTNPIPERRCIIAFERITKEPQLLRSDEVSLFWLIMQDGFPHDAQKPFSWALNEYENDAYVLNFSSFFPEITKAFLTHAQELVGKVISFGHGHCFKLVSANFIQNIPYVENSISLRSVSGVCLRKTVHDPSKKSSRRTVCICYDDDAVAWKQKLIASLVARYNHICGGDLKATDVTLSDFRILFKDCAYYGGRGKGHLPNLGIQVRITAPKPLLEFAAYAGLGEHTGVGFGYAAVG